ncbi:hypothetical protein ACFO0N_07985 [Halobium salinum]|uniref:Uncharacterized protein n=1 Tax=Halobium salinum TaxID=1364940 RepID=A0ABD5PAG6_9EURY|nr:hypothetical protein [Halobium salinum]
MDTTRDDATDEPMRRRTVLRGVGVALATLPALSLGGGSAAAADGIEVDTRGCDAVSFESDGRGVEIDLGRCGRIDID